MRRQRGSELGQRVLAAGVLWSMLIGCSGSDEQRSDALGAKDALLRINQLQAKGTHNSYHIAPNDPSLGAWLYTHAPLAEQLQAQGVRAVELDTQYDAALDQFEVVHLPGLDEGTTCRVFADCLRAMKGWSDQNLGHHLLFVQIEPKETPPAEAAESYFQNLEGEILSVWPRERVLTPDDVRGSAATLREAVESAGWPTLGETRGKVLFYIDNSGEFRTAYTHGNRDLNGRLMFVDSELESPYAGVLVLNDPVTDAVTEAVTRGFIVRTRADADRKEPLKGDTTRRDAALASGAHIISTDYPAQVANLEYSVTIPEGTPSRCNPISAPSDCRPKDIETPRMLAP